MKFASFETVVEMIYGSLSKPKNEYGKTAQTAVSFTGRVHCGYTVRDRVTPSRCHGGEAERQPKGRRGLWGGHEPHLRRDRVSGVVEWIASEDRHDRDAGRVAVDELRYAYGFPCYQNGQRSTANTMTDYFKIFMGLPTTGSSGQQQAEKK